MLTKLTDLDLSFNYIEKIENLEKLTQLEVISLYSNRIQQIENLHHLEHLQIVSLAKNCIKTYDGIEKLRFLKKLSVINLEDNPISRDLDNPTSEYVAAFLSQIKYYNYTLIADETRASAREKYSRELRKLEEIESEEKVLREKIEKDAKEEVLLRQCFVEFLNRHQLFDSLFDASDSVLNVDEKAIGLRMEFKDRYLSIAEELRKVGVDEDKRRQVEIAEFRKCIEEARRKVIQPFLN
uniref:Dynein axonemal assembly factor 1 homolog n=1 Tax=Phlebotomus papatasi TaxID=29031 RepID=A0A1B0DCP6_PHLPP